MKIDENDTFSKKLEIVIHWSVRALSVLMVLVIVMGVIDVAWTLYQKLITPPLYILTISDMLATFGAFMAVLIAIEIIINITIYLRENVIHVKIVMATALMAIARKVIIIDADNADAIYIIAVGIVVLSMSIGYWLIHQLPRKNHIEE
ncbi:Protoporphyrinogen IX oxidase [Photobacterium marinum]|uniref:Protoporphyrinogen IX oxidase n=1 Tax=Photobacterium marinum TaxID=1056511 RepID=L8JFN3_9GAMM|nr:phosphate-starvation-inducible PsiE family protein [Photobacterium marinum]ELR66232.1 Protoporphyrinogen IX oxidase [Photobacterium marinum]